MSSKNKTYIVTGGAGFIGSNFVKHLIKQYGSDVTIVVVDALTYAGNLANISEELKLPNVHFEHKDIRDREAMLEVMTKYHPEYVVNFAAESHVDRSIKNPRIFLETNILGTQSLLDASMAVWRRDDGTFPDDVRFLQVSTDEVYGALTRDYTSAQNLELPDDLAHLIAERGKVETFGRHLFTEQTPLAPRSPYSASKASADMLVAAYSETYGLPVNITRCSNNYGPYQFPEKLIPLLINNIFSGKALPVYGEGLNVRDWLYVDDHCAAIDLVLNHGAVGEVYNIGGLNEKQNIDIVKEVIQVMGKTTNSPERYDLITHVRDRQGHDMRYAIDPSKLARELSWNPATPFSEGIVKTVQWYISNRNWLEDVTSGAYQDYYKEMYSKR